MSKEHRLRAFENNVLRRMFGSKMEDVTRDCRKLSDEELHNSCTKTLRMNNLSKMIQ
jgi:hypothetical protein